MSGFAEGGIFTGNESFDGIPDAALDILATDGAKQVRAEAEKRPGTETHETRLVGSPPAIPAPVDRGCALVRLPFGAGWR